MAELKIDFQKCIGCGLCIKSCATGALHIEHKKVSLQETHCTMCGICTQSCRFNALSIEKENSNTADLSSHKGIWVYAEQKNGSILPVALELLGKGRLLANEKHCELTALISGRADIAGQEKVLIAGGADHVIMCQDDRFDYIPELDLTDFICTMTERLKPEILLLGATGLGRSLAPRIAARMRTGLTADCTVLEVDPETGLLRQTRPAFGGNLMATIICPDHRPQMATVRPGVMAPIPSEPNRLGRTSYYKLPEIASKLVEVIQTSTCSDTKTISDAKVIVSVRRGIGAKKNMALAYKLASLFGGEVGVSRALVDIGWGEYRQQIGQTGYSVAPKLLIACGISGAIQHLAGIGGAQTIIAINKDPDAKIFSVSHYAVVGDCVDVLTSLIAILQQ